jgi:flotillin
MRIAELDATQIAQAKADAAKIRLAAEANADAEAVRIRRIADATAESIEKVNRAIQQGGEAYFKYRQIEMLPELVPQIAKALAESKMVTISGGEDGGAPNGTTNNISQVIQTVLAAQLVGKHGVLDGSGPRAEDAKLPTVLPTPAVKK